MLEIIGKNSGSNNRNITHVCQHGCFMAKRKLGWYWLRLAVGKEHGKKTRIWLQYFWAGWQGWSFMQSKLNDLLALDEAQYLTERFYCSRGEKKKVKSPGFPTNFQINGGWSLPVQKTLENFKNTSKNKFTAGKIHFYSFNIKLRQKPCLDGSLWSLTLLLVVFV